MFSAPSSAVSEPARPSGSPRSHQRDAAVLRGLGGRLEEASVTVEAIMAAGRQLVQRDGLLDFNVRELLALAQVSNRAFYRYFATKQDLIAALAEEVYGDMLDTQREAVAAASGPIAELEAWVDDALSRAHDPQMASRGRVFVAHEATLREQHPDLFRSVGRAMTTEVLGILERGRDAGAFSPSVSVAQARLIVRLVIGTLEHHVLARSRRSKAERQSLIDFIVAGCQ